MSNLTPAQQAFIATLQKEANKQLQGLLDGSFEPMSVPGGFYWANQGGPNNVFNPNMLAQVDCVVEQGNNGILTLGSQSFTSAYKNALQKITYALGTADQAGVNKDAIAFATESAALVNAWEKSTSTKIDLSKEPDLFPKTKLRYVLREVAKNWPNGKIPAYMDSFIPAYMAFKLKAAKTMALQQGEIAAEERREAAMANLQATTSNGGLEIDGGSYLPAFGPFKTPGKINGDLGSPNALSVSFDLSSFNSQHSKLQIGGQVVANVPLDIVKIGVSSGAAYGLSKYASQATKIRVKATYEGLCVVSSPLTAGVLATNLDKGWYANEILAEAAKNQRGVDTGYSFILGNDPAKQFGPGAPLSRIKTWVISREPTLEFEFTTSSAASIKADFSQGASVSFDLFGFIGGSVNNKYEVSDLTTNSAAGTVSLTLRDNQPTAAMTWDQRTAFVIGGVPSYPPVAP